jgi:phosphoribosylglycinamide formyltransferase 1
MTPVGVLVSGRGSNLAALIDRTRLRASPFDIACVVSDNPEAGALTLARNAGIPAFVHEKLPGQKKREYEQAIVERLRAHGVRVVALAGFMRILGETLLSAFPGRVLNIHPSLLPAFPGLHAQEQAHAAGVRFAGCTVHVVDAGTDTGPILDQACFRIPGDLSAQALSLKILEHEHRLYPETLARFCRHEFALVEGRVRSFAPPAPLRPAWESFSASHFAQEPPPAPDPGRVRVAVSACLCGFPLPVRRRRTVPAGPGRRPGPRRRAPRVSGGPRRPGRAPPPDPVRERTGSDARPGSADPRRARVGRHRPPARRRGPDHRLVPGPGRPGRLSQGKQPVLRHPPDPLARAARPGSGSPGGPVGQGRGPRFHGRRLRAWLECTWNTFPPNPRKSGTNPFQGDGKR